MAVQGKVTGSAFVKEVPKGGDPFQWGNHVQYYLFGCSVLGQMPKSYHDVAKRLKKLSSGAEFCMVRKSIASKNPAQGCWDDSNLMIEQMTIDEMARKAGMKKANAIDRLEAFKAACIRDEQEVYFDHIGLWKECTVMLGKIRQLCYASPAELLPQLNHPNWVEVVPAILTEMASCKVLDDRFKTTDRIKSAKISVFATMLEKVIKTSGSQFIAKATSKSSSNRRRSDIISNGWIAAEKADCVWRADSDETAKINEWLKEDLQLFEEYGR